LIADLLLHMEFPVVILPFLEEKFKRDSSFNIDHKFGFAFNLNRSLENDSAEPFACWFLKLQNRSRQVAEEKRLFYVAATRARDHLFMLGSIDKKGEVPEPGYLSWLLKALDISPEAQPGQRQIPVKNFEITVNEHVIEAPPEKRQPEAVAADSESVVELLPAGMMKYQFPAVETPGRQTYSATQLMLFKEAEERYFRHFYLNEGWVLPPQTDLEYSEDPGGALWGTAAHRVLENFQMRDKAGDDKKIRQVLLNLGMFDEEEGRVFREKLQKMLGEFRQTETGKYLQTAPEQFAEYAVNLRLGNFTLKGIFDCLFKNEQENWEVLDFKTNRIGEGELESTAHKYEFQMQAYALLLSGLFPKQENYPVTLFFLEPMKSHRRQYSLSQIEKFKSKLLPLMENLRQVEIEYFNPHSPG
jgi:ATP-dependent helicase/nuclease subunit A